jgi:hypothetical protein
MRRLRTFGNFWYDFVVGDDWTLALGVVVALGATYALSKTSSVPIWWLLPSAVAVVLISSLVRGVHQSMRRR